MAFNNAVNANVAGLQSLSTTGTWVGRTITGSGGITINNGNGINGNPDISLSAGVLYPITPYVVGPVGLAGYQTIQSAMNAANGNGGGAVYIQKGTYTENLTCYNSVALVGVDGDVNGNLVQIVGTHTPPTTIGTCSFRNINFYGTTSIFLSSSAGQSLLAFDTCNFVVSSSGYPLNLPNWTGPLSAQPLTDVLGISCLNCKDLSGGDSGFIQNNGGCYITLYYCRLGIGGATVAMTLSGVTQMTYCDIYCPVSVSGGNGSYFTHCNFHNNTFTTSGASIGSIEHCAFMSNSGSVLTHNSTGSWIFANNTVSTTQNPAIAGTGSGSLQVVDIGFLQNSNIAGTLTLVNNGAFLAANLSNHGILLGRGNAAISALAPSSTSGQILQSAGASADPSYSTATYPSTTTVNQILWSSGSNIVGGLTTGNNGVLITSATGVPSFLANGTTGQLLTATTGGPATWTTVSLPTLPISLANGGTGASLTASNGGIFYSNASTGAILGGTATANQMLQSGASSAPSWSSSTWPASTTANQILYSSATNTVGGITTANNSVLLTNGSGVPSLGTTLTNNFNFLSATSGSTETVTISNSSNTANSSAALILSTAGTSAGNPWTQYTVGTSASYSTGINRVANNAYSLNYSASGTVSPTTGTAVMTYDPSGNTSFGFVANALNFGYAAVGFADLYNFSNSDNTNASSACRLACSVGGTSAGDPYLYLGIPSGTSWEVGLTNANSDALRINSGVTSATANLSGTNLWEMSSTGARTMALQPCFLVYNNTTRTSVTGDGTTYLIIFDQKDFDQSTSYSTSTGLFTAPKTGRYLLNACINFANIGSGHSLGYLTLATSNNNFFFNELSPAACKSSGNIMRMVISIVCDMDAADTASVSLTVSNSTKTINVASAIGNTNFSGALLA